VLKSSSSRLGLTISCLFALMNFRDQLSQQVYIYYSPHIQQSISTSVRHSFHLFKRPSPSCRVIVFGHMTAVQRQRICWLLSLENVLG
jgi:hypothetical protein